MSKTCLTCEEILVDSSQPFCSSKCELISYLDSKNNQYAHKDDVLIIINK